MRNVNCNVLSAADSISSNGIQIDSNQLVAASFHAVFSETHAAGTFKLQISNDICNDRYQASQFTVTNWTDLPNQSASVTVGGNKLLSVANMTYRWIRAVYTSTANYKEVQTVQTVPDVDGSLNSTYFTIQSIHSNAPKDFYVWFDNGSGVDPAIPGSTGVHIVYTNNATANTLAGLINTALAALTSDFTSEVLTDTVTITSVNAGAVTAAADGVAPTGFTFDVTNAGVNPGILTINMNALSA